MAAAAAAAAFARASQGKQLDMGYKMVAKLKDIPHHVFSKQLHRAALANSWDANLWDLSTVALTTDRFDVDELDVDDDHDAQKRSLDRRNAYLIIMHAADGHPVEDLLEANAYW